MTSAAFPIALRLAGRRVLVAGGGEAAARAQALAAAGARVHVVAPSPDESLRELSERGVIELSAREARAEDVAGNWLVVQATRDEALADRLALACEAERVFFCAVDDPRVGSFSHLAIARAGKVFAAFGSQGEAPALARRLRELFESAFARADLAGFSERLAELRRRTPAAERRAVLGAAVAGVALEGELVLPGELPDERPAPHSNVGVPEGKASADGDG